MGSMTRRVPGAKTGRPLVLDRVTRAEIARKYFLRAMKQAELAKMYGVAQSTISRVICEW